MPSRVTDTAGRVESAPRQKPNVFRMNLLGAKVAPAAAIDAVEELAALQLVRQLRPFLPRFFEKQ